MTGAQEERPESGGNSRPDGEDSELDEEIAESFPASDPPSHWSGLRQEGPTIGGRNGTAPSQFTRDA